MQNYIWEESWRSRVLWLFLKIGAVLKVTCSAAFLYYVLSMYYVVSVNVFTIYLQTWASSHLSVEFCIVQVVHSNNFVTNFLIIKKEIPCLIWEGKWWSFFFTTKTNLHIGKTSVIQVSIKPSNTEMFSLGYMDFVGIKKSPELDLIIEDYFLI